MVLVMASCVARAAHQSHVVGTEILKGQPVSGTALQPQLIQGFHHSVCPERRLLMVSLKVPGTQRHFTFQAGLHSQRLLIYTVVAENLRLLRLRLRLPAVQLWCGGSVTFDDAGEFEVFLQGLHTLILHAALWATWKGCVPLVGGLPDAGSAVVVSTGENHRIREQLKADRAAQLED